MPERLVFIDETWVKTNMTPLRGWAPCGQRLPGKAPYGHWKTMTFLAALRHDRIDAPWFIEGPIDGAVRQRIDPGAADGRVAEEAAEHRELDRLRGLAQKADAQLSAAAEERIGEE